MAQARKDEDSSMGEASNDDPGVALKAEKARLDRGRADSERDAEKRRVADDEHKELAAGSVDGPVDNAVGIGDSIRSMIDELVGAFSADEAPAAAALPVPERDAPAAVAKVADRSTSDRHDSELKTIYLRARPKVATYKDAGSADRGGVSTSRFEGIRSERSKGLDEDEDATARETRIEATRRALFVLPESVQPSMEVWIGTDPDRVDVVTLQQADVEAWITSLSTAFEVRALNPGQGDRLRNEPGEVEADAGSTRARKAGGAVVLDLDWIVAPPERYNELVWGSDASRPGAAAEVFPAAPTDDFVQDTSAIEKDRRKTVDPEEAKDLHKAKARPKPDASQESKDGAVPSTVGKKKGDGDARPRLPTADPGAPAQRTSEPTTEPRPTALERNAAPRIRIVVIYEDK